MTRHQNKCLAQLTAWQALEPGFAVTLYGYPSQGCFFCVGWGEVGADGVQQWLGAILEYAQCATWSPHSPRLHCPAPSYLAFPSCKVMYLSYEIFQMGRHFCLDRVPFSLHQDEVTVYKQGHRNLINHCRLANCRVNYLIWLRDTF